MAHCINKCSSACVPVPACDVACTCHRPCHSLSLPKRCSAMLFAHQRLHGQNAVPLSETSSLKLARSYTTRLPSCSRSDSPTSHCPGNHGIAQLPSRVCARRGTNADSPEQRLLWSPAPQDQARGGEEELGPQHFSPWGCTGKGE